MKILVIGSGGREHALVWKLSQNPKIKKIYCAPGNAGIAELAECVSIVSEDVQSLLDFAKNQDIDLTVVGPELPLSLGIVDEFEKAGLKIFGPTKNAAALEFSKHFTKEFCLRHGLPTAPFAVFYNAAEAKAYLENKDEYPIVIKADGLALGKGVVIAQDQEEAFKAIDDMMVYEKFGDAGKSVVIEEFMRGEEATLMVVTDGENFIPLESAQDHKRAYDNDEGPNTGGMGALSPAPLLNPAVREKAFNQIIKPLIKGMKEEGRPYKGVLYAGLMIHKDEPRLVEFNCRFGDPEAQAILFRLKSDFLEMIEATLNGKLDSYKIKFSPQPAVCVVMAAGGYPGEYQKGKVITGLDKVKKMKNVFVFHAGTRSEGKDILTNGGRVLGVTASGKDLKAAIANAYEAVKIIRWDGVHYRKDIGARSLKG